MKSCLLSLTASFMAWQADQPVSFTLMPKKRGLRHEEEEEEFCWVWFRILWNLHMKHRILRYNVVVGAASWRKEYLLPVTDQEPWWDAVTSIPEAHLRIIQSGGVDELHWRRRWGFLLWEGATWSETPPVLQPVFCGFSPQDSSLCQTVAPKALRVVFV